MCNSNLSEMILLAESEQAGVRPGQSTVEENRAGNRALHNQRKGFLCFRLPVASLSIVFGILANL